MSAERAHIDALVATIASRDTEVDAGRSIIPSLSTSHARERIHAMLEQAAKITVGDSIGVGGRGVVNAAEQLGLRREVAVKKVRGELTDAALVELLQEAMITGSLEHPNIVPVHYIGVDDDGEPFIVLKKIDGVGWDQVIGDLELEANLEIFLDVINAVRFAHSRGIIHRDLKPANVMVGEFGEVYVLDWGLAVSVDEVAASSRRPTAREDHDRGWLPRASDVDGVAGTLAYMAPEMLTGVGLSKRTDVYLLGALLCEMTTGRPPHKGSIVTALVESITTSEPDLDGVPAELAAIIGRAMSPDPADRFASADELKEAIEAFMVHREASRLTDEAFERLGALLAARESEHDTLYNLFGECRFGFREAIRRWPEGQAARDGLERAVTEMVEYELERGEAGAAERLLSELEKVPEALRARVTEAVAKKRDKLAALERLEADLDPRVAGGWRVIGALVLGLIAVLAFTFTPLVSPNTAGRASWPWFFFVSLGAGAVFAVVGTLMRRPLFSSRPNRLFGATVVIGWMATVTAIAGLWIADAELMSIRPYHPIIWFCCFAMLTVAVDRRLWPGPVVFLATALAMPSLPPLVSRYLLIANLLFMVIVVGWVSLCRRRELADCRPPEA